MRVRVRRQETDGEQENLTKDKVRKKIEVEGEQIEKKKKCVEKSGEKSEKNYAE